MAGRRQVFSDPTVIQLASEQFIPVAENSSALERQADDRGEFFRHVAEQGHFGGRVFPTRSRQGSYAFTADGRFLASVNTLDGHGMAEMMRTALARWARPRELGAPAAVRLALGAADDGDFPVDGLVLQVAVRDLPRGIEPRPDDWPTTAWNLDYAWIRPDEARALVPESREVGRRRAAPWAVCRRLARFHLRDFVRGEPYNWPEDAIRRAELWSEIVAIAGTRIRLALRGAARIEHVVEWIRPEDGEERRYHSGYDCTLYGEATWDDERGVFVAFELVADGRRWGASQYNNREDDLGPAPLGIAFVLAGSTPSDRTPPHCLRFWPVTGEETLARPAQFAVDRLDYFG